MKNNETMSYVKDFLERKFVKQVDHQFKRLEGTVYEGDDISSYYTDKIYVKPESSKEESEEENLELEDESKSASIAAPV